MPLNKLHIKQVDGLQTQLSKSLSDVLIVGGTASQNILMGTHSIGFGTLTPSAKLHVVGDFKLVDGSEASGYILTSDATGVASWSASSNVISGTGQGIYAGSGFLQSGVTNVSISNNTLIFDSTSIPNLLYIDGSIDKIGIGTGVPSAKLHINGNGSTSATTSLLVENNVGANIFKINDDGGWALGKNSTPNDKQTVIIGNGITSTGIHQILLGSSITPQTTASHIMIGRALTLADAVATTSIIIGDNVVGGSGSITIGTNATSTQSGVTIGTNADALDGVSVGQSSQATGGQATAVGRSASATLSGSTAYGHLSNASAGQSTSIGQNSTASGVQSSAFGYLSMASGIRSLAMMRLSNVSGINSIAIGYAAEALVVGDATSIGSGAEVTAAGSQMIGWRSLSTTQKITNSVANSIGFGWDTATPDVLFAKTANQYIAGTGLLGIGTKIPTSKLTVNGDVETLLSTSGFIVLDRTDGKRYRIYTDGGVLNTEFVP